MISNENIDKLCNLFSKFLEPNNSIRESAENEVNQLIQSDIIGFIKTCSEIIMNDGIERNIVFYAIQNICRALTPYNIPINTIRGKWMTINPEIRNYIKTATFRGLMFQEENITNMSSKAICVLAIIEREEFFPVIEQVITLLPKDATDDTQKQRLAISALYLLKEILSPPFYSNYIDDIPNLKQLLNFINQQIFSLFMNGKFQTDKCKEMIASVQNALILCYPSLFKDSTVLQSFLPVIDSYFSSNPTNEINEVLCQILYNLTTINYWSKDFDFSLIFNLLVDKIMKQTNPIQFSSLVSYWNYLSKFENNLVQKIIKYKRLLEVPNTTNMQIGDIQRNTKSKRLLESRAEKMNFPVPKQVMNYTKIGAINLSEKFLSILSLIDPNNLSSEARDAPREPHMYAICCLRNFFKLNHRIVFESVRKFWMATITTYCQPNEGENLDDSNIPWTTKHALLLSISVICGNMDNYKYFDVNYYSDDKDNQILENLNYDPKINNDIINFITNEIFPGYNIFNNFILQSVYSPIPRIVDTALYVIQLCVDYYGIGVILDNPNAPTFPFLMASFKHLMNDMKYDEIIFERILNVLSVYFIKFAKKVDYSQILAFENEIFQIIGLGLSAPLNSYNIYMLSNSVLENLIRYSKALKLIEKVFNLTISTLTELMKFNTDSMTIIKQQQSLHIISCALKRKEFIIPEEQLLAASRIIFHLMEQKNQVFEEALRCLIVIIIKLENASNKIFDKVMQFVPIALSMQNYSVISITTEALANLYKENTSNFFDGQRNIEDKILPQNLIEYLPRSVDLIISFLKSDNFHRDYLSTLLVSLAKLIRAARHHIPIMKAEEIKSIYYHYASMPLDLSKQYEVEFGNDLYEGIFTGLSSVLMICGCFDSATQNELRRNKNSMREFINVPTKVYFDFPFYSDGSLTSYCYFLRSFHRFFGNFSNILLNRLSNFKPLFYALVSDSEDLKKLAFSITEEIDNA